MILILHVSFPQQLPIVFLIPNEVVVEFTQAGAYIGNRKWEELSKVGPAFIYIPAYA